MASINFFSHFGVELLFLAFLSVFKLCVAFCDSLGVLS